MIMRIAGWPFILAMFGMGLISGIIAKVKGHSFFLFFFIGLLIPFIGLFFAISIPISDELYRKRSTQSRDGIGSQPPWVKTIRGKPLRYICRYCNGTNEANVTQCKHCGAPLA